MTRAAPSGQSGDRGANGSSLYPPITLMATRGREFEHVTPDSNAGFVSGLYK